MTIPARFTSTITVTRHSAGSYVDGQWVEGSSAALTLTASVQPLTQSELMRLPEAIRTKATHKLYSDSALQAADEHTHTRGDLFTWDGKTREIVGVERHHYGSLAHYKSTAVMVDP